MKAQKEMTLYSIFIAIITLICMVLVYVLQATSILDIIGSIMCGISTGMIVTFCTALMQYKFEKIKTISLTKDNLISLFSNMHLLKEITSKYLLKDVTMENIIINDLENNSKLISDLTKLNTDFTDKMNLDIFCTFSSKSKLLTQYDKLKQYKNKIYNLNYIANDIQQKVLLYDLTTTKQQENCDINLYDLKTLLIVKISKFHEYEASLLNELDDIISNFYTYTKSKDSWNEYKNILLKDVEEIIKNKVTQ